MSYTHMNLRDAEDMAPRYGIGELQESRFLTKPLGAEATGVSLQRVKPGRRQPFAHRHERAEEVYVVLSGRGRLKLDDQVVEIGPMDAIRIAPQVMRAVEAGDEGVELLIFGPRTGNDTEISRDPDFWD